MRDMGLSLVRDSMDMGLSIISDPLSNMMPNPINYIYPTTTLSLPGESCHNDNNPASTLDNLTKDFLVKLNAEGRFDNAILIMMSDHGARFANRSI